ncbi:MAG: hypothetical protein KAU07_01925 [Candidatus Andersenbacteria bacterium]|nr:hypothetical protein [Candidatus Andersenbacteria bacterium]
METVKDKLDRLNDLTEEQIQNTESFFEEMKKLNDTGSALTTKLQKEKGTLYGGLFFSLSIGLAGLVAKRKELELQKIQMRQLNQYFTREAKKDFLKENREEIEELTNQLMADKIKVRELVRLHVIKEIKIMFCETLLIKREKDTSIIMPKDMSYQVIEDLFHDEKLMAEFESTINENINELKEAIELLLKNEYEVKKIVKLHINEKFLENFEM